VKKRMRGELDFGARADTRVDGKAQRGWERGVSITELVAIQAWTSHAWIDLREFQARGKDRVKGLRLSPADIAREIRGGGTFRVDREGVRGELVDRRGHVRSFWVTSNGYWLGRQRVSEQSAAFEAALRRAPRIAGTLYRGLAPMSETAIARRFRVGAVVCLGSAASFSEVVTVAKRFADKKSEDHSALGDRRRKVIVRVAARRGRRIAALSKRPGRDASHAAQRETVLLKRTRLKITDIAIHDEYVLVDMREQWALAVRRAPGKTLLL